MLRCQGVELGYIFFVVKNQTEDLPDVDAAVLDLVVLDLHDDLGVEN